jgi:hypothetical protein
MTTYNVPSGTFSTGQTLTAEAGDTVTFADRAAYLSIANLGTSPLWIRTDGQAAVTAGENSYAVQPGATEVFANGLPTWYPSSRVIPQGVNEFGGGNTRSSAASPGSVTPMESLAGQMANPGTQISLIAASAESYTIAFAG